MRKLLQRATLLALITGFAGVSTLAQQVFVPGLVKAEVYSGFGGTAIADLTNNAAYPGRPSSVSFLKYLEYPAGLDDGTPPASDVANNYGVRISGFIIPAENGNYTFYIAADDNANFFLSTNEDPANRSLLAWEPTWNGVRNFEGIDRRPGCLEGDCENVSTPIALVAGQRYYFEALMKEGTGGDNLAVAWSKDGAPLETITLGDGSVTTPPIGSLNLGTMADSTVSITRQPSDTAAAAGGTASFSVGINATPDVTYQWRKGIDNIPGATSATYTTPALTATDNNALYSVVVTKTGGNSVTSADAKVTVATLSDVNGVALIEIFNDMGGTVVPANFSNLGAPNSYGTVTTANSDPFFTGVPNGDPSRNNYLGRMSGYFIPTTNGNYHFFIRSDDASKLWMSPNASFPDPNTDPATAHEQTCCRAYFDPGLGGNADGSFPTTLTPIPMVAGQKYAFIYYWKEGGGGDYGQIAVREELDFDTLTTALAPIPAANLATRVPSLGIVTHPQPRFVEENRNTSFTVLTLPTPGLTFQWQSAPSGSTTFTDVANGTNRTLNLSAIPRAESGRQYRVVVTSGATSQTSSPAVLTVTDDVTPPVITTVGSFHNRTGLVVYFNEPVNASAGTFTLNNGATVTSSTVLGPTSVFLQTSTLNAGAAYTLTVGNVRDLSATGGNLVTPNTATFTASAAAPTPLSEGLAKYERWDNVTSIAMALTEVTNRPPDVTETRFGFEGPVNIADNYGGRLTGWFVPPSDGNYIFSAATDDNGRLWLSTDSNPANKRLIAQETGWAASRAWSGIPDKISSTFAGTQWPGGNTISLKGGQPYYMELNWHEGGGGDNGAVTFWKQGEAMPANSTPPRVSGAALLGNVALDPSSPPGITGVPVGQTFTKGDNITLTVTVAGPGPFTYQWIKNKRPIDGATGSTYVITDADHTDIGDYSVLVSNANGSVESGSRGGDDASRLIMRGAYVIEAEDYNYEGGKHLTVASTMPYLGNAYAGLLPTLDVDFMNGPDQSGAAADAYAYGPRTPIAGAGTIETKGGGDPVNNAFNRNRGSFTVNASYATGWGNAGDWQNYTRTFPPGRYAIIAGVANDGDPGADPFGRTDTMNSHLAKVTNPTIADGSSPAVEVGLQGLTQLGVFNSPVSGAWSSNDLIPLTDATTGAIVEVQLSGTETLRWTNDSSLDMDYLLLYCLNCVDSTPTISISRTAGTVSITYTGTLQSSATLGATANWTTVTGATSPYTVPTADSMRFFRSMTP